MEDLEVGTPWGSREPIQSNELDFCLDCNVVITEKNDSGWEGFKEDGKTTQKLCNNCNKNRSKGGLKSEN